MNSIDNYLDEINKNPNLIKGNEWVINFLTVIFLSFENAENKLNKNKLIKVLEKLDTNNSNLINLLNKEE